MLKFSIKPYKYCINCTSNSKKFYHLATGLFYFYDGTDGFFFYILLGLGFLFGYWIIFFIV